MAENVPPGAPIAKGATSSESTARGLPYYEKLRRDLRDMIQKKRLLDKNLVRQSGKVTFPKRADLMSAPDKSRRNYLPSRKCLPRRDLRSRQYHQGLRQLHKVQCWTHFVHVRFSKWHDFWKCSRRRSGSRKTKTCGQPCRPSLL